MEKSLQPFGGKVFKKNMTQISLNAIKYCLKNCDIDLRSVTKIVYYEKPLLTFERLLETYLAVAPRGIRSFITAMQIWLKEKLFLKSEIKKYLRTIQNELVGENEIFAPEIFFAEHHQSHAAAAFYPSPFEESVILCMDGVGEWATTSAWVGKKNQITPYGKLIFRTP